MCVNVQKVVIHLFSNEIKSKWAIVKLAITSLVSRTLRWSGVVLRDDLDFFPQRFVVYFTHNFSGPHHELDDKFMT